MHHLIYRINRYLFLAMLLLSTVFNPLFAMEELLQFSSSDDIQIALAAERSNLATANTNEQKAIANNNIGVILMAGGWYSDAFGYFKQSESLLSSVQCNKALCVAKSNLSLLAHYANDKQSLPKWKEALFCARQLKDKELEAYILINNAKASALSSNYSEVFSNLFRAQEVIEGSNSYYNDLIELELASALQKLNRSTYGKYYTDLLQEGNAQLNTVDQIDLNIVSAYIQSDLNRASNAYALANSARDLSRSINSTYLELRSLVTLANIELERSNLNEAKAFKQMINALQRLGEFPIIDQSIAALDIKLAAQENLHSKVLELSVGFLNTYKGDNPSDKYILDDVYTHYSAALEKSGDLATALQVKEKQLDLNEYIAREGAFRNFEQLRAAYELKRQDTKSIEQQAKDELSYQEQQIEQVLKYSALIALLVLSVLLILLYRQVRVKKRTNATLEQRNTLINQQNQELRKMNTVLEDARQQAEAGSVAKSNFLAVTSHEIRTPMNGIMGMASLLLESELNEEQKKYVETIQTSSENLLTILNDILDFSKIEAGKMNIETTLIDLEKLLDEVMIIFSKQAKDKNIELSRFIGNAMINQFRGDVLRIRQVLINLVSNAIKFTENGQVRILVELDELLRAQTDDARIAKLRFSVRDNGIGISEEKQKKIFESFEQEDTSTSRKYGGIGLGLSISKKLVELMGGEIGLTSEKGVGTTFYFTLNVEIPNSVTLKKAPILEETKVISSAEPLPKKEVSSDLPPLRILLAEDNPFNKLFIDKLFEKFGYTDYLHAENGLEVLDLLDNNEVDLILMDIQMPEMDGLEATKKIIEKYQDSRPVIIALTADANSSSKNQYLDAGMDGFLSKPFKAEDLKDLLEEYSKKLNKTSLVN